MQRPLIWWSWPEPYAQSEDLRRALAEVGDVRVDRAMPDGRLPVTAYVPHLSHEVNADAIGRLNGLKVIATPTTGIDHLDLAAANRSGICVLSLRGHVDFLNTLQSTAELAWLLMLATVRRFPLAYRQALAGQWDTAPLRGNELIGKSIGIVGLGRLGKMVARFALAFGMRVFASDPVDQKVDGVTQVTFDELLRQSDIVTLHVHLDETTHRLIDESALARMKPGAVLINTSRGAIVDEAALLQALHTGHLRAAGLDVLTGERDEDFAMHPVIAYARTHDNVILTPHVGGCTVEAQTKAFLFVAKLLALHLNQPSN